MARNKLAQLLIDSATAETEDVTVSAFGVEQITGVRSYLLSRLRQYDGTLDYDPLFEIAKIGLRTDNEKLAVHCHNIVANHFYPTVKALDINTKVDKEVNIRIELADYARPVAVEVEAEELEVDEENEREDYETSIMEGKDN